MHENAKVLGIWGFWALLSQLRGRTIRLEHHIMSQILQVQQTPVFWCKMHITISKYLKYARKCINLGNIGFLGQSESIAGLHGQIRVSGPLYNLAGAQTLGLQANLPVHRHMTSVRTLFSL